MEWISQNKQKLQWLSFLLVALAFPMLTIGVNNGDTLVWVGMLMVALGFALPPLIRLLGKRGDGGESQGADAGVPGPDSEAESERHSDRGQRRPEGGG